MTNKVVHNWLKANLDKVMRVQISTLGKENSIASPVREVDLVVHIWGGVKIHIHIIDEPIKTRVIKKIVENATGIGIATIFIVHSKLLPAHGQRMAVPPEWLMALHALTGDKIYTYTIKNGSPVLQTARFAAINRTTELEMQHGPAIGIEQIRYFQKTVRPNFIKGYWMVGDFGPDAPLKKDYYKPEPKPRAEAHQHIPRPQQTTYQARQQSQQSSQSTKQKHYGNTQNNSASNGNGARPNIPPPPASRPKTRLEISCEILGVSRTAEREEVKAAFRKLAFQLHPDVSTLPKAEAEARFKSLSEAYEYIKTSNKWP